MSGKSTEKNPASEFSDSWSERDTDPEYYSINNYRLNGKYGFSAEGISPNVTVTFQKAFNPAIKKDQMAYVPAI